MKRFVVFSSLIYMVIFFPKVFASNQTTYFGLDYIYGVNGYKNKFGGEILDDTWTSGKNAFVGHYFSQWLVFELGYQQFLTKFKVSEVLLDEEQFGIEDFSGISDDVYNTKTSMRNININWAPKFNINQQASIAPIVGLAHLKARISVDILLRDGEYATAGDKKMLNFECAKSKIIPRVGVRGEYLFTKNFGTRVSYVWEHTSAIKLSTIRENISPPRSVIAKLKNTQIYSVGIFYNLMW